MREDGFVIELILVAVLILLNGFFAGAEIAVVSARRTRLARLAAAGDARAQAVLRLKDDPDRFLATVQIGVTLVGTLASAVGGVAAVERLEPLVAELPWPWLRAIAEPIAVTSVVFVIAYLSLVVGELVPKSLAMRHAESVALFVARFIEQLLRLAGPAVGALTVSSRFVLRLIGRGSPTRASFLTLDDLRAIVREAELQGLVKEGVLRGAIEFHDREVREVLTPAQRVDALPVETPLAEAARVASASGHSRLPVFQGTLDNTLGMVFSRQIFEALLSKQPAALRDLLTPVAMVPWSKPATLLLRDMQTSGSQLAMVVDEHGAVLGMVTLEDLLEVIVGDIRDEHEPEEDAVRGLSEGVLEVDGAVSVRDLNADHGLGLPESPEYVTVAGLLLARLGAIPREDEIVELPAGLRVRVLRLEGRRVARVRIEKQARAEPETAAS